MSIPFPSTTRLEADLSRLFLIVGGMRSLNLFLSISLLPLLALPSLTQSISPTSLAQALLPSSTSSNLSSILGQQVELNPFSLTLITNDTHVQATFNVSQPYDEVGWIAMVSFRDSRREIVRSF